MKIISLGWGAQSFTLAAMVALGKLEPVDAAVHADTTHESAATYDFAARWTEWLNSHGVKVVTVRAANTDIINPYGGVLIPAFTAGKEKNGQIRRQCTYDWKIQPMRAWISAELERRGLRKKPGTVEQWIGISLDEFQRMKQADVKYIVNRFPLIEMRMTRADCVDWLKKHGLEIPPRSACVFCPFKSSADWRQTRAIGQDWRAAVEVDEHIRTSRPPNALYIHPSRKPLADVDFRTAEEKGQISLWDSECEGVCGV